MPRFIGWTSSDWRWAVCLFATLIALLVVNPVGYVGGGWDDWQYLNAARCWVEHGSCLPRTHWEGRWPVFVPIAGIFELFGESRLTLSIWPFLASVTAAATLVAVGNKACGRPVGWLAAILLVVTPTFSTQLLDPRPEPLELAFILAGIYCVLFWQDRRSTMLAFCSGICFALAFQVRETSLIATLFAAIYVATRRPKAVDVVAAIAGFAFPLAIEFVTYWMVAGDPLFRRRLSVAHTQILSSELVGPIDHERSPFFNPNYIANWRHEPGLHVHWLIDGLVNLFVNAKAGATLLLTPVLWLTYRHLLDARTRVVAGKLYLMALLYAATLIYALAVDPKARVMLVPLAATTLAFSLLAVRAWQNGKRMIPAVMIGGQVALGILILFIFQRTDIVEGPARQWISQYPGEIEIDPNTRRHLELVPGIHRLPEVDADMPLLLYESVVPCDRWWRRANLPAGALELVAQQPLNNLGPHAEELAGGLCLFRYRMRMSGEEVRSAIRRSRRDGSYIMDKRSYLAGR